MKKTILPAMFAATFLVRLILAHTLEIIPDEAYYRTWSRTLDICYYDQPGMIAWIEYFFGLILPIRHPFFARLPMLMLGSTLLPA